MNILKRIGAHFKSHVVNDNRGFLQALLPLLATAGGSYLANKSNKQNVAANTVDPSPYDPRNPDKARVDAFLADFITKYGSQYEPQKAYTGKRTAGMSGFETQGLEQFLTQFLNGGVSSQTNDVRGLLNKTVNGGFDPGTSPYYQALRDESAYNNKRAVDANRANLGARKKFFTSEAIRSEGDINAQTAIGLNKSMADLANSERARSLSAVPAATALEEYITNIPLQKANAATSLGSLPRLLEQNDLESLYQDFLRRQKEGGAVVSGARGISGTTTEPYQPPSLVAPQASTDNTSTFLQKFLGNVLNRAGGTNGLTNLLTSIFQ